MDTLPVGTQVDPLGELIAGGFAGERDDSADRMTLIRTERRGLSTVDRVLDRQTDYCKQCAENIDPYNVPVHPGCNCDVKTLAVEMGVAPPDHRLLAPIMRDQKGVSFEDMLSLTLPDGVVLDSSSVAIFEPGDMRYGDLLRWLEQAQSLLDNANYVAIAVDEGQDLLAELGGDLEFAADTLGRKFWVAVAKEVVL